ncbi:hypothetical protein ABE28_008815 [Peribacillus muralis]|uniref:DNA-binding protein n=1 Tax=Peribacillus muralis TaxID=264697 RepID=A0A1B3XMJ6_9BACI|nr:hypothetical protein [Peribacillus muralis]AOH54452.1 hypothetical protein ABE28_008815 [Peribacillus muralis]
MSRTNPLEYAVYKGDEFLCLGTAKECATYLGVTVQTIRFMVSPTYRKRTQNSKDPLIAIKVDDE